MKITRYPVILVHGIILKDNPFFKSFGKIEKNLKKKERIMGFYLQLLTELAEMGF